jgi:hypothetical protein
MLTIPKAPDLMLELPTLGKNFACRHITRATIRLFNQWETGSGTADLVYQLLHELVDGITEEELDRLPYPEAVATLRAIGKHTQEVILALGKEDADSAVMATDGALA